GGDSAPGRFRARQRGRLHARVVDDAFDLVAADEKAAKHAVRYTGFAKYLLDGQCAARYVRGVLEQAGIARDERGRGETEYLPEGKIPRHDGEHHAERLVGDVGAARVGVDDFICKKSRTAIRIVRAGLRAFFDFRARL